MTLLPFSYPWLFRREIGERASLLDVGCGKGRFLAEVLAGRTMQADGVELFEPYIKEAIKTHLYKHIFRRDIRKASFPDQSYDVVLCSQVMEHFPKGEAIRIIRAMKRWTGNALIVGVPNGHFHQEEYDGNKLQEHHSSWTPEDFVKLGFRVYGQGLNVVYGQGGLLDSPLGKWQGTRFALYIFSYLTTLIPYFFPKWGTYIVAVWKPL